MVKKALFLQNTSVVICSILLYLLFPYRQGVINEDELIRTIPWDNLNFTIIFILLCIFNSISSTFSMACSLAVERDWIVALTKPHSPHLLTRLFISLY